jgi:hypothetical protein
MKKGNNSIAEYVSKAHTLADEMALASKKIDDEELISYILAGLDYEYNTVVSSLVPRPDVITIGEVYSQLVAYKQCVQQQQEESYQASANAASRGRGAIRGCFGSHGGRSPGRGRGRHPGHSPSNTDNSNIADNRPRCQVCFKKGHLASDYWNMFDDSYISDERYADADTSSYANDSSWYLDTGATDHVTRELEKLAMREKYKGKEKIHGADGAGMRISHISHSVINTPDYKFILKDVLHVPKAHKNLVFVYRLTKYNSIFLEIHPGFFLIKDQASRRILLSGCSHCGLYPHTRSFGNKANYCGLQAISRAMA